MVEIDRSVLLRAFLEESEELVAQLERSALALDTNPGDLELLSEMYRIAHTLKGNATMLGFDGLTRLLHEIEGAFAEVTEKKRTADRELADVTLSAVDVLRLRLAALDGGSDEPVQGEARLVERIFAWVAADDPHTAQAENRARPRGTAPARRSLRIEVSRLDRLLDLVGEVSIAQGRLALALDRADVQAQLAALQACQSLFRTVQESVLRLRLVPLGRTFERFRRAIRELARAAGKQVELVVEGGEVEVDMALADALRDPLAHMVRNAIDHGIEAPKTRLALGKPATARITLRARHESSHVVVEVEDDGAGMNRDKLVARAAELGLNTNAADDEAVWNLAFAPGLSTAQTVTDLSGRGIGMDVVRRDIEGMRGSVSLHNRPGRGVTVNLRLPLTVALIQGFGVGVGSETYIVPLDSIVECVDLEPERTMPSFAGGVIELRGQPLPFLSLADHVEAPGQRAERRSVVVLEHAGERAGLAVDALLGEVQTVIKPLGQLFSTVRLVSGTAVLGDGRIALVLDVGNLLRAAAA